MSYRLSADIGGTFTDVVRIDEETGEYISTKVLTTNDLLTKGVLAGFDSVVNGDYSKVSSIVHGTTSGLNAVIERRGAKSALITTKGFRDVYSIGRGNRPEIYNNHYKKPVPLIPRKDIYELDERITWDGAVLQPLDEDSVKELALSLKGKYEAIAICFINSYVNPAHEKRTAQIFKEILGEETAVVTSFETANESREYERTSTTVLNAYIIPKLKAHLAQLKKELAARGYNGSLYIMQSNGGIVKDEVASVKAVQTFMSGPVGGAIGARVSGRDNLIGVDMGGTSFDVSLLVDGALETTVNTVIEGFPALVPSVNILSVGAGGGSIAWTEGEGMRVGPISAGSNPGPVCYGRGGVQPAVTDANLVLGHLDKEHFLDGRMELDEEKARQAFSEYGKEHGLSAEAAAEGVLDISNHKMADAIRQITVQRGIDPRGFSMLAFGGAGPMHAALIAEELDIREVLIPQLPGAFSAWGMLQADVHHDGVRTIQKELAETEDRELGMLEEELHSELTEILETEGFEKKDIIFQKALEMRYVGQSYAINVDIPEGDMDRAMIEEKFHAQYLRLYGHCSAKDPVEVVNLRVRAVVPTEKIKVTVPYEEGTKAEPVKTLRGIFKGKEYDTAVYKRDQIVPGQHLPGPAVIVELTATTVVPPNWDISVNAQNQVVLTYMKGGEDER